jgi:hypothetical protein
MMNKLNMQADPPQKASPRTDCLRNGYLATDDRSESCGFQKSLESMSLILVAGASSNDAALDP